MRWDGQLLADSAEPTDGGGQLPGLGSSANRGLPAAAADEQLALL